MPRKKKEARAEYGEGSIKQRSDGLWVARLSLGTDDSGKRKIWQKTGMDEDAVRDAFKKAKENLQTGRPIDADRVTVRYYLNSWLDSIRDSRSAKTYSSYKEMVENHVIPFVGDVTLAELSAEAVDAMMVQLAAKVDKRGKKLSARTRQYARAILITALNRAVKRRVIDHNPAAFSEAPKVEKSDIEPLAIEDAKKLLAAIKGHPLEALYSVALGCGLRQGEAFALRWSDIDLDNAQIVVRGSLEKVDGEYHIKEIKTGQRGRVIALPAVAVAALAARLDHQRNERLAAGFAWKNKLGLAFTTSVGTPLDRFNVRRQFQMFLKKAGLPHARFYDLRHTCASLLYAQGVSDKAVQEILGHTDIRTTLNTYTHIRRAQHREAAKRMDELLSG